MANWFELEPLLERDYREFSGGEQMRAALACFLVKGPKVVVTDQLADQIDPDFRHKLFSILARWSHEDGGIQLHFATALRDDFGCQARHCAIFHRAGIYHGKSSRVLGTTWA